MTSSTFAISIAAATLSLCLSGCGGKPDVNADASKAEQPFAMKEVPAAPTQVPVDNASPANPAEVNTDANAVPTPPGVTASAGSTVAAQKSKTLAFGTADQRRTPEASSQAATTNVSEGVAMKTRLRNGRKATTEAQ